MNKVISRCIHIRNFKSSLQITISQFVKAESGPDKLVRLHTFDNPTDASLKRLNHAMQSPYLATNSPYLEREYQAHYYVLPKFYPVR